MNISSILRRAVSLWPGEIAIIDDDARELTYAEVGARVAQTAQDLSSRGLGRGTTVAALSPNCAELFELYFACAAVGARLCPINTRLAPREVAFILRHSEAEAVAAHPSLAPLADAALAEAPEIRLRLWPKAEGSAVETALRATPRDEVAPDEVAHLYYTSGTTGDPKGVMLTHRNVTTHALAAIAELHLTDQDRWLHAAPMFHLADAWATFAITWVGGTHLFLPTFDAAQALTIMRRGEVTLTNLIPTMLSAMVDHPDAASPLPSLRVILSGGAPIAPETVRRVVDTFGCEYIQTYGMTETSPYLTVSVLKDHHRCLPEEEQLRIRSRTGRPLIGVELEVLRRDGSAVARDDQEVGEIVVRGPTVTPGYWRNEKATAEALRDGWLHTGDLAVVDSEGYVNIVDRKKDMIITGGENVYTTEVEHALYEHPRVAECAVVGVPHPRWGEAVTAMVVLRPGQAPLEPEELISFVRQRIAGFKTPKQLHFVDALPKTGSGKIAKAMVRRALADEPR